MTNANTNTTEWAGEMIFSANGTVSIKTDNPQVAQWKLNGNTLEISHDSEKVINTIKQQNTNAIVLEYKKNNEHHTMMMKRVTSEESLREFISQ